MSAVQIRIYGDVQGVFYRVSARDRARELGLVGFARNEPDGTVCIKAQGSKSAIDKFIDWCKDGSSAAQVRRVEVEETKQGKFADFTIQY